MRLVLGNRHCHEMKNENSLSERLMVSLSASFTADPVCRAPKGSGHHVPAADFDQPLTSALDLNCALGKPVDVRNDIQLGSLR